jgi:hypothetical protein
MSGYFAVLRGNGVAYVLSSWTRMPDLPVQAAIGGFEDGGLHGDPGAAAARAGV